MDWPGVVGVALLVYAPMSYLLLRGGLRRRMWLGAVCLSLLVAVPGFGGVVDAVVHGRGTDALGATALACWLGLGVAVGFRPLTTPGAGRYGPLLTAVQIALLSVVSHLLGSVVERVDLAGCCPPPRGDGVVGTLVTVEWDAVPASDAEVGGALLFVGVAVFLVAHGHARIHGPLDAATDRRGRTSHERRIPRERQTPRETPSSARSDAPAARGD